MNTLNSGKLPIVVLAKMWREDGVWNVSAFDIPVIAYGNDFETATDNFKEALDSHFNALKHFKMLDATVEELDKIYKTRNYADLFKSPETVQSFQYPAYHPALEAYGA